MRAGERCDEIVRMIDEVLADYGTPAPGIPASAVALPAVTLGQAGGVGRRL